jgi:hypothetical protein
LSIQQLINPTLNSTEEVDYEQLMIDEEVIAGIISMFFLLLIFVITFFAIDQIKVAQHLTDTFETTIKKNQ